MRHCLLLLAASLLFLVACGRTQDAAPRDTPGPAGISNQPASPTPTSTPQPSPTATLTPTATATPTPSPTPTPTALPLQVIADNQAAQWQPPPAQANAPCGVVDILDFPMNPPDADNISGGQDFGVFRNRYGKFHAGEDWWGTRRGSTFGEPVYSIGHGLVTYAEPEGWNRDKGVVIIQHTLRDGSQVLSFYGHLDPPSIVLQPGYCVERGQQVGNVGRPRGSPHLHFEIRTQSPYATLTGYWPEDPTSVGWLPPSQFIWQQRMVAAPGVQWIRPFVSDAHYLGLADSETLLALEKGQVVGLSTGDGRERWRYAAGEEDTILNAALDAQHSVLYLATEAGQLQALSLTAGSVPALLWEQKGEVTAVGPRLLVLPGSGLLVSQRQALTFLDQDGREQWSQLAVGLPLSWATAGPDLYLVTSGGESNLWRVTPASVEAWEAPAGGQPFVAGETPWLYTRDGLYRLDQARQAAVLRQSLPAGSLSLGDVAALADGRFLLAHVDRYDRRLLLFNPDGSLQWERSYGGQLSGSVQLVPANDALYVLVQDTATGTLVVYLLDQEANILTPLFTGGSRSLDPPETWVSTAGQQLWIALGGGATVALDTGQIGVPAGD